MITQERQQKHIESCAVNANGYNSSFDLKFISELGRSLHLAIHPLKVAKKVAESMLNGVGAAKCAVAVELKHIGLVSSAFDENGEQTSKTFNRRRFKEWIEVLPLQIPFSTEHRKEFFFKNGKHKFEYISPLHVEGEVRGAVIVGFDSKSECNESTARLIDAATQMTAMSINLSSHYEAALSSSVNKAKEQHQKFTESVLDALPVSLYVIDKDYRIVMWNSHREIGLQGEPRDSVVGRNVFEVLSKYPEKKLRKEFERAFQTGKIERIEQQTTDENGETKYWVVSKIPMRDENGAITHVITIGEDVTARVDAIHAAGRAEKLAAVGRLAAGVVHEINNPLATISACAEALEARVEEGVFDDSPDVEDLGEYLGLIRNESFRCKSITNGLLEFSRGRTGNRYPIHISEVIESSVTLIKHQSRGENINISLEIEDDLPLLKVDEGQIQQAIIALSTNAIDAMPEGGELTFRAYLSGKRVAIEIQDTGAGIDPEDLPKIFEPFFTTKEIGKGTGLGLAVCYGIIMDHDGRVSVRSKIGQGTTFTIYLPIDSETETLKIEAYQ